MSKVAGKLDETSFLVCLKFTAAAQENIKITEEFLKTQKAALIPNFSKKQEKKEEPKPQHVEHQFTESFKSCSGET